MTKLFQIQQIYHLVDERNWKAIQTEGLLSATQLLKRAGLDQWIDHHRPENLRLPNGSVIRDQRPIPPAALSRCLTDDLIPADWYTLLNNHIFFWIELDRLDRQRRTCTTPQYVISIDAKSLLAQYAPEAAVTPFNVGNARRVPARRGLASFVPYNTWINSGWESEATALGIKPRPASHKPVELTIKDFVPNIFDFVTNARRFEPDENFNLFLYQH